MAISFKEVHQSHAQHKERPVSTCQVSWHMWHVCVSVCT